MCKWRNNLIEQLRENIVHQKIYQKQPWTMVEIDVIYEGHPYTDIGFAKVQYPDKWDAQYGVDLCVNKALASIARTIMDTRELLDSIPTHLTVMTQDYE